MMNITQHNNEFQAHQDDQVIGRIEFYHQDQRAIVCTHTFVIPEMRGQKVAQYLLDALTRYAKENQFKIIPQCSYVSVAFNRYPQKYSKVNADA